MASLEARLEALRAQQLKDEQLLRVQQQKAEQLAEESASTSGSRCA